jgi:hypothetical protein
MRISFLPFAILFCVLVSLPACSEDSGPTNPNDTTKTIDTTDTTNRSIDTLNPCRAGANTLIISDGFVLDGGGFNNTVFNFNSDSSTYSYINFFIPAFGTYYSRYGTIRLPSGQSAFVRMTVQYLDTLNKTYEWTSADTSGTAYVRIDIEQNGVTKALRPFVGATRVLQAKQATLYGFGTFCGYLKDSASGAIVAVKSGEYYIE